MTINALKWEWEAIICGQQIELHQYYIIDKHQIKQLDSNNSTGNHNPDLGMIHKKHG